MYKIRKKEVLGGSVISYSIMDEIISKKSLPFVVIKKKKDESSERYVDRR
jgi:hypothetical protein